MDAIRDLLVIARQLMADESLSDLEDALDDLDTLSSNLDRAFDDFGQHFRIAALDPEVTSQFDLLRKAKAGLENANLVLNSVKRVLQTHSDDKTAQRVLKDAETMISRFQKHVQDARKVVMTISKKAMPETLKRFAADVARRIRTRLVDPDGLEIIPWQEEVYNPETRMTGVQYQVLFRVDTKTKEVGILESTAEEWSTGSVGATWATFSGRYGLGKVMSPQAAADMFLTVKGWDGIKGEGEAISNRANIATQISAILDRLTSQFDTWGNDRSVEISKGNTLISGSYRSSLPKEGERSVGESSYGQMVQEEIKRWRKVLEPAMKPFEKDIAKLRTYDGEKSWIYTEIELK